MKAFFHRRMFVADYRDIFFACDTSLPSNEQDAAQDQTDYVFVDRKDVIKGSSNDIQNHTWRPI